MTYDVLMGTLNPTHSLTHAERVDVMAEVWRSHGQLQADDGNAVATDE